MRPDIETVSVNDPNQGARGGRPRSTDADHALLTATLATLQEHGYAGLSMIGVAKRAGVSATTLYRRWSTKADLVAAAVATLNPIMDVPDSGTIIEDLRIVLRHRAEALRNQEGKVFIGLIVEIIKNPEAFAAVKERFGNRNVSVLAEIVARAVDRGEIPPIDTNLALDVIAGPFWSRMLAGDAPSDQYVDDILPMLVAALKAAPTPSPEPTPSTGSTASTPSPPVATVSTRRRPAGSAEPGVGRRSRAGRA
jgi:AcrR family transcriptional regulator